MIQSFISKLALAFTIILGLSLVVPELATANFSDPPDPCSKFKKGSKQWKECMGQVKPEQDSSAGERFAKGYWLAKTGDYAKALETLKAHPNQNDPGVLTMIGYATRHMGQVDEALGYYTKALAQNPNLTNTRQYLGEAYLQKHDVLQAKVQLAEIARICGNTACEDYQALGKEIAAFESNG